MPAYEAVWPLPVGDEKDWWRSGIPAVGPEEERRFPLLVPGTEITVSYPRWNPDWEAGPITGPELRQAAQAGRHTFVCAKPLPDRDARIYQIAHMWWGRRLLSGVGALAERHLSSPFLQAIPVPFLSQDGTKTIWALYSKWDKRLIPMHRMRGKAVVNFGECRAESWAEPEKREIMVGEPLRATVFLKNTGTRTFFYTAGWARGVRPPWYAFYAFRQDGARATDPYGHSHYMGGAHRMQALEGGAKRREELALYRWAQFDRPGTYTVSCCAAVYLDAQRKVCVPIWSSFDLEVKAPNHVRHKRNLEGLARRWRRARGHPELGKAAGRASDLIIHTVTPEAVPHLASLLDVEADKHEWLVVQALGRIACPESVRTLTSIESDLGGGRAVSLGLAGMRAGHYAYPQAIRALEGIAHDPAEEVGRRVEASRALVEMNAFEALSAIQRALDAGRKSGYLTADSSARLEESVERLEEVRSYLGFPMPVKSD